MTQLNSSGAATQPCLTPLLMGNHLESLQLTHTAFCTLIQLLKECDDFSWDSEGLQDVPEGPVVHSVEGSLKVNEGNVEVPVFSELPGLFY